MNEQIKELAEQAGLDIDDSLAIEPEPTYYGTQSDFERFVKLIVRECAAIALREDHEPSECILKHFGVKE